jgi:MFS family permease
MAARLVAPFGPMRIVVVGMLWAIVGMLIFRTAGVGTAYFPTIALANFAIGTGVGLTMMPLLTIAMSDLPPADRGLGSGITTVSQRVGGALSLAVLSTLATTHTRSLVADGHSASSALVGGYHLAFTLGAGGSRSASSSRWSCSAAAELRHGSPVWRWSRPETEPPEDAMPQSEEARTDPE